MMPTCWRIPISGTCISREISKFCKANGWEYVSFFERWRPQKVPFRFIVLDSSGTTRLNMACTVDTFEPSVRRNGDIAYTITITEYPFVI